MATTFKKVSNNGQTTLLNTITIGATSLQIQLADTSKFPASGNFWVNVYASATPSTYETMLVTTVSSNTWTVTRAQDGTSAVAWTAGAVIELPIRAEHVSDLNTAVNTLENAGYITAASTNTLTNKTYNLTNNTFIATIAQLNTATAETIVTRTGSFTLTNKTLTSPLFSGNIDGWVAAGETWTFYNRSQAYTNDPSSGSSITLNMASTTGFVVGAVVTVSSSSGSEDTLIVSVVANTSITVSQLSLNHTTSSPLVTIKSAFTVSGDVTSKYGLGDKLRWVQTTTKYGYVIAIEYDGSSTTRVHVSGGSDYSVTNTSITNPFYSRDVSPAGFPKIFNYTPIYTCSGSMTISGISTTQALFYMVGSCVFVSVKSSFTLGGSAASEVQISLPLLARAGYESFAGGFTVNGATLLLTTCQIINSQMRFFGNDNLGNWSTGAAREIRGSCFYPAV